MPGGAPGDRSCSAGAGTLAPCFRHNVFLNLWGYRLGVLVCSGVWQLVGPEAIPNLRDNTAPAAPDAQMLVSGAVGEIAIHGLEPR